MNFWISSLAAVALLSAPFPAEAVGLLDILDSNFDAIGGKIEGLLDLSILDGAPEMATGRLGSSPWYGRAEVSASGLFGYRGGVEVNASGSSDGVGAISYGATLGGLLGSDVPATYLWQPLAGLGLAAKTTYTLTLDVSVGSLLSLGLLSSSGFGVGITTNSSPTSYGSFYTQSTNAPTLLSISLLGLGSSVNRLTYSFTTEETVPAGDMGLVVYAGYGFQGIGLDLGTTYRVDNVPLSSEAVPEPGAVFLLLLGLLPLASRRVLRSLVQAA